jgi:hypothetical protein
MKNKTSIFNREKWKIFLRVTNQPKRVNLSIHISGYAPRKLYEFQEYYLVGYEAM